MTHFFKPEDRSQAAAFVAQAQAVLDTPAATKAELQVARDLLADWHAAFHSRNRPPDPMCTNCHVWPVVQALDFALTCRPPVWGEPRIVDEWYWMDLNLWSDPGILWRCARVSWDRDGTRAYSVSIDDERSGFGFYCWPSFRVLSEAQEEAERLIRLPFEEIKAEHGKNWQVVK